MSDPRVSVIVTTYNWPEALEVVLRALAQQQRPPDEVVVADDGSREDTRRLLERIARDYPIALRHSWHEDNGFRVALARNRAIAASHGDYVILLDGHSIRSEVPRFFAGRLPDLNLGTADGATCAPSIQQAVELVLAGANSFTSVVNGRFKGGYVTRHYGDPARGVHALQLEIAQACYMDERPPYAWETARAAPLGEVLSRLVAALLAWR